MEKKWGDSQFGEKDGTNFRGGRVVQDAVRKGKRRRKKTKKTQSGGRKAVEKPKRRKRQEKKKKKKKQEQDARVGGMYIARKGESGPSGGYSLKKKKTRE